VNHEGICSRCGIQKPIGKLRTQHGRDLLTGAFEGLSKSVSGITALGAHMACDAAVDGWVAKRIASESLQELGHGEPGNVRDQQQD